MPLFVKVPYGNISAVSDLGRIIRAKRKSDGKRQVDLAKKSGVGTRFISDLENGKKTIEMGKVFLVLEALEIQLLTRPKKYLQVVEEVTE